MSTCVIYATATGKLAVRTVKSAAPFYVFNELNLETEPVTTMPLILDVLRREPSALQNMPSFCLLNIAYTADASILNGCTFKLDSFSYFSYEESIRTFQRLIRYSVNKPLEIRSDMVPPGKGVPSRKVDADCLTLSISHHSQKKWKCSVPTTKIGVSRGAPRRISVIS
jgi:hypothetical protein